MLSDVFNPGYPPLTRPFLLKCQSVFCEGGGIIEKLITDDKIGESYRCVTSHWFRYDVPPLAYHHDSISTCVISDLLAHGKACRPAGAIIETLGFDVRLPSEDAHDLDQQIRIAIESTIVDWIAECQEGVGSPGSRWRACRGDCQS